MIPPLAPGQSDDSQNMVGWKNTFNMRQVTLMNLSLRSNNQSRNTLNYMQNGCITSPIKSLDLLRKNLQNAINKDIDNVIKKYLEKFFQPAVNNIRNNLGRDSINEEHIKEACCKMLEEAKSMYSTGTRSRDSSPYDYSDSETGSLIECKFGRPNTASPLFRKRKESDTDSETSHNNNNNIRHHQPKRTKLKSSNNQNGDTIPGNQLLLNVKRDIVKWNPERISTNTLFIMGAKANKVLGFGQTRGRLYVRHPELVRYSGDNEDKEWLSKHNLMPPTGGKAYLMLLEDIRDLIQTDEYKSNPNLQLQEFKGFEAPPFMLIKIRNYLEMIRSDLRTGLVPNLDLFDFQTSQTPPIDSAPSTPDTLQMLECQSASTVGSNANTFIQIPEVSPGSNHSYILSPLPNARVSVSPNLLINFTTANSMGLHQQQKQQNLNLNPVDSSPNLSTLLASHLGSDNSEEHDF